MSIRSKSACLLAHTLLAGAAAAAGVTWEAELPSAHGCRLNGCCPTDDGGVAAVGELGTPDREITSFYMAKLSPQGALQWDMSTGWGASSTGHDVLQAGRGYVICGELTTRRGDRDGFLLHLDYFGLQIWSRRLGGGEDDSILDMAPAPGGGFYLVGYTESEGSGGKDLWLMAVDSEGGVEWSRTFGDTADEVGCGICVRPDSSLAVCGGYGGSLMLLVTDREGEPLLSRVFDAGGSGYARSVASLADGSLYLGGSVRPGGGFLMDAFAVAADSGGDELWRRSAGGPGNDCGGTVLAVGDSLLLVYSTMSEGRGSYDAALEVMAAEGTVARRLLVGDAGWNRVCDAEAPGLQRVILAGGTGPADAPVRNGWAAMVDMSATDSAEEGNDVEEDDDGP